MQTRVNSLEEAKDPTFVSRTRGLPLRLLLILLMFLVLCAIISFISLNTFKKFGFDHVVSDIKPSYDPCIVEGSGLDNWIRPFSSNLMHTMSDEELFWRASFVPRIKKYPFNRTTKIAFMFLTKGPLPLAPLWERFFKGHEGRFSIYIHSMPSYTQEFPSNSVFYRRHIPSKLAEWGKMSMCDAEKRLLANALLDISNEWFVLLSESCVPLYNFSVIHNYISRSKYSFMGAFDDPGPFGRGRYNENMAPEVNLTQWRKGSQWFEINRRLAINIVEDNIFYHKFEAFCKPHCYVDEHYFPTMLTIRAGDFIANRSITFVDWSRGGAHPATFGRGDITEDFFKKIVGKKTCKYNDQNSSLCYLFARKFAPSTLQPLLQISPAVLGF
ncbi:glycosyltransferase BC10-like [Silene latifolia]|uniref:glycosyltransferase BC10-like n=1 Tax=Silene latifolia TaxID=37657 RepID=UPI003D785C57